MYFSYLSVVLYCSAPLGHHCCSSSVTINQRKTTTTLCWAQCRVSGPLSSPLPPAVPAQPKSLMLAPGKGLSPGTGSAPRPRGHRDTQDPQGSRDGLVAWQINTKMNFLLHIPHPGDTGWVPAGQSRIRPWQGCKALHSSDFDVLQKPTWI